MIVLEYIEHPCLTIENASFKYIVNREKDMAIAIKLTNDVVFKLADSTLTRNQVKLLYPSRITVQHEGEKVMHLTQIECINFE